MKSASLPVFTNFLAKFGTNLRTFAQTLILLLIAETLNFLFAQSLLNTLMLGARNGAKKILPIQLAMKVILLHHQLDINKQPTNLPIL